MPDLDNGAYTACSRVRRPKLFRRTCELTPNMSKSIDHIFVDLDGTLVRTDLFFESILQLIKRNPVSRMVGASFLLVVLAAKYIQI